MKKKNVLIIFEFLKKNRILCYSIKIYILITVKKLLLNILIFHGDTGLLAKKENIFKIISQCLEDTI